MVALISSMLGSYHNQTGPTPAELRDAFLSQRGSAVEQVVKRAAERGEIDPALLTGSHHLSWQKEQRWRSRRKSTAWSSSGPVSPVSTPPGS
jgi:hypothetical protein